MVDPSRAVRRTLALAILAGLAGLLYYIAVRPVIEAYRTREDKAVELQAALARYDGIAREQRARRAELSRLRELDAGQGGFLQGSNETLLAAQLQNRIKALVNAGEGELISAETLPVQEDGRFRRIAVRAQFAGSMSNVLRVFYGLESSYPLLILANVALHAHLPTAGRARPPSAVEVSFDVYGLSAAKRDADETAQAGPRSARPRP